MQWSDTNNPREDSVFARVKAAVRSGGGPKAVVEALRQFRELEDEQKLRGEKGVTHKLFIDLLRNFGVRLHNREADYLCTAFDDDQDGYITSSRFVRHFTGLNFRRHRTVLRAWDALPKNERGEVSRNELQRRYTLSGTGGSFGVTFAPLPRTQRDMQGTDTASPPSSASSAEAHDSGTVSPEEFIAFFAAVSVEFPLDEQFELYMLREWDADVATRPTMNETQRDWDSEGGDPLAITKRLCVQDVLNNALGVSSKSYNFSHMPRVHPYVEPLPPLERDYLSITKRDFRPFSMDERIEANTLCHR
ncbi:hypothetical protein TraAM80_03007 [Trypanosoma rangeli]|uniref:EF-hand domain-containing protein n=1 Tax=Trypanosoma rangeli TaxID=5698 RepID=A0A3R7MLD6_TRYRA|nr:uncharacterized protein TraAM80_03007 [Trypanosoma rangeli]RNF07963.1 hypothetical protein TraAM80_03007 [Trypanosoma rangeli]|eukprot:RNF07963.1 hypothetical protein TraAM80_03007 [Trypanosoma rangeli]